MIKTLSDVHRWIFSKRLLISAGELEIGKLVQIRLCPRQSSAVSPSYGSRKSLETFANIVIIFWAGGKKRLRWLSSKSIIRALISCQLFWAICPKKWSIEYRQQIQIQGTNTKLQSQDLASAVLSDPTPTAVLAHSLLIGSNLCVPAKSYLFPAPTDQYQCHCPQKWLALFFVPKKTERFTNQLVLVSLCLHRGLRNYTTSRF